MPHHLQIFGVPGLISIFFPNAADVDSHCVFRREAGLVPHPFINFIDGEHPVLVAQQSSVIFSSMGVQFHRFPIHCDYLAAAVHHQSAGAENLLIGLFLGQSSQLNVPAQLDFTERSAPKGLKGLVM